MGEAYCTTKDLVNSWKWEYCPDGRDGLDAASEQMTGNIPCGNQVEQYKTTVNELNYWKSRCYRQNEDIKDFIRYINHELIPRFSDTIQEDYSPLITYKEEKNDDRGRVSSLQEDRTVRGDDFEDKFSSTRLNQSMPMDLYFTNSEDTLESNSSKHPTNLSDEYIRIPSSPEEEETPPFSDFTAKKMNATVYRAELRPFILRTWRRAQESLTLQSAEYIVSSESDVSNDTGIPESPISTMHISGEIISPEPGYSSDQSFDNLSPRMQMAKCLNELAREISSVIKSSRNTSNEQNYDYECESIFESENLTQYMNDCTEPFAETTNDEDCGSDWNNQTNVTPLFESNEFLFQDSEQLCSTDESSEKLAELSNDSEKRTAGEMPVDLHGSDTLEDRKRPLGEGSSDTEKTRYDSIEKHAIKAESSDVEDHRKCNRKCHGHETHKDVEAHDSEMHDSSDSDDSRTCSCEDFNHNDTTCSCTHTCRTTSEGTSESETSQKTSDSAENSDKTDSTRASDATEFDQDLDAPESKKNRNTDEDSQSEVGSISTGSELSEEHAEYASNKIKTTLNLLCSEVKVIRKPPPTTEKCLFEEIVEYHADNRNILMGTSVQRKSTREPHHVDVIGQLAVNHLVSTIRIMCDQIQDILHTYPTSVKAEDIEPMIVDSTDSDTK